MAASILLPAHFTEVEATIPPSEITATSVVPPDIYNHMPHGFLNRVLHGQWPPRSVPSRHKRSWRRPIAASITARLSVEVTRQERTPSLLV